MSEVAEKIMDIYRRLRVKVGKMLLVQALRAKIEKEYIDEIVEGLEELVKIGYLEQKDTAFFLTEIGSTYLKNL